MNLLSTRDVARRLGCSNEYAAKLCRTPARLGGIKALKVGKAWRIRPEDLDAWIETQTKRHEVSR